jgi:hypothetical protein
MWLPRLSARCHAMLCVVGFLVVVSPHASATITVLFDEDFERLGETLTQWENVRASLQSSSDSFTGLISARIEGPGLITQRQHPRIPGWRYRIVESPADGTEARWFMWAWKKTEGSDGMMIQFTDDGRWGDTGPELVDPPAPGTRRYIAGENQTSWSGVQVAEHAPFDEWIVVVRDLWADFGEFTLTGIAFTPFDGVGLYDTVYLAHTKGELASIVAGDTPITVIEEPVSSHWFPEGTTEILLSTSSYNSSGGHWHWRLNKPFPKSGVAGGTMAPDGNSATIAGLADRQTYAVYVVPVDADHQIIGPQDSATFYIAGSP